MATLNDVIVLFGGIDEVLLGDTWTWDGATWTQQSLSGPSPRSNAAMATVGNQVMLFGGSRGSECGEAACWGDDTWTWDGTGWTRQSVAGPSGRLGASMAAFGGTAVLFGGSNGALPMGLLERRPC
jgi:N-acetylneuraminic acid mutarotase